MDVRIFPTSFFLGEPLQVGGLTAECRQDRLHELRGDVLVEVSHDQFPFGQAFRLDGFVVNRRVPKPQLPRFRWSRRMQARRSCGAWRQVVRCSGGPIAGGRCHPFRRKRRHRSRVKKAKRR
jgi:hypothetical protein